MSEFSGMVAIVTGSSSGIGERTAQRLAELGAHVVVNSASSVEAGQKVADSLPNGAIYVQADISDKAQCQKLIDATIAKFGKLDVLVNNAGWTTLVPHADLDALTDEIFEKDFQCECDGNMATHKNGDATLVEITRWKRCQHHVGCGCTPHGFFHCVLHDEGRVESNDTSHG